MINVAEAILRWIFRLFIAYIVLWSIHHDHRGLAFVCAVVLLLSFILVDRRN